MARLYELSDEAWGVVSDLFIETHGRGRAALPARCRPRIRQITSFAAVRRQLCLRLQLYVFL